MKHANASSRLDTLADALDQKNQANSLTGLDPGQANGPWAMPSELPNILPEVPAFDYELLPSIIKPMVEDSSDRLQCPPDYFAAPMLVGMGSLIGRQAHIAPKAEDDWLVVPNLWGAIVGRPGVMKSPALREALLPIMDLEKQAAINFKDEEIEHEIRSLEWQARKSAQQEKMKKAAKDGGSLSELAAELVDSKPSDPACDRYMVSDATVEKLGELLNENPNGLLLMRDELTGFLRSLDRQGREQDRAFYLEAWNGDGTFTYDRIGRGTVRIEAATVSIIGGIQPGPLSAYIQEATRGGRGDDGLLQRFQFVVWPNPPRDWRNVDRRPNEIARNNYRQVCTHLANLDEQFQGTHRFDPAAQELFNNWRMDLENRLLGGDLPAPLESHFAKYRSLVPSIALILSLAESNSTSVLIEPLAQAIAWTEYLEEHSRRLYASAIQADMASAHGLLRHIHRGELKSGFTLRDVYRKGWANLATRDAAEGAMAVLVDHHVIREYYAETGGRPVTQYQINPEVRQ